MLIFHVLTKQIFCSRYLTEDKGPKDKHYGQGAMLAFLGTVFAIEVSGLIIIMFHNDRCNTSHH